VRIDQGTIREILARTDIGTFIGTYVQLRKRGNDLVGLCPFHGEKTPSFHVHPDRGFFKCFGCGAGGDVLKFVQQLENLSFPDAARLLARRAGIELEAEDPAAARVRGEKEHIYAANAVAAAYFQRMLVLAPEGAAARAYVAGRGLDAPVVDAFKLGFAPPGWDGLARELAAAGVDPSLAVTAGLLKAGERSHYDFYRNRLMIPTYSTTGEVVAFGGRALDDAQPKYLNTSTTPVYAKGRSLYALNVARRAAAQRDSLIVVEGYLDCIALHQAGFTNAVASLGTSFTSEQAAELRKYATTVLLCFDSDAAGSSATEKSIGVLKGTGCTVFIVQLPPGEDPDTFVRTHGAAAFQVKLDSAIPDVQFALDRRLAAMRDDRRSAADAARTGEQLVQQLAPREEWDRWRVYTATTLGLAVDDLRESRFRANAANFAPRGSAVTGFVRHAAPVAEPPSLEREVLAALVDEPGLVAEYAGRIPAEAFRDGPYRQIYEALRARAHELATASDVYAALGDDRTAVELVVTLQKPDRSSKVRFQDSAARRAHLDRVVEGLIESRLEQRRRELDQKIDSAFLSGVPVLQEERDELARLREELERRKKKRLGTR
jgi:DNA primase